MTSIKLIVTGAKARAEVSGVLTSGTVGIPVEIEYDGAWDTLSKNLICTGGKWGPDGKAWAIVNIENSSVVAHEAMTADHHLYLGIEGRNAEGTLVIATTWADCGMVVPGASVDAVPSVNPTMPVWADLQMQINRLKENGYGGGTGEDGGYYTPGVTQLDDETVQYDFTPSKADMPAVKSVQITLPGSQSTGLTTEQINALDGMFKVAGYDESKDVASAYAAFQAAFGLSGTGGEEDPDEPVTPDEPDEPAVTLTGISATYSGGDVAVGTAVSDLIGVIVTAEYSDGTTEVVTDYTLSGTIAEGVNTITVTYQGMTATFTVTGVAESGGEDSEVDPIEPVSGYTFYDYITNPASSNDYIATGLTHSPSFSVLSTRFWVKPKTLTNYAAMLGCRTTAGLKDDNAGFGCWITKAYKVEFGVLGLDFISETAVVSNEVNEVAYKFVDGGVSTATINGVTESIATASKADIAANTAPLYINAYYKNGSVTQNPLPNEYELGRIIMSDGENVVYDFVPAYEEATAKYGYYERINSVFYPSKNGHIVCGNWGDDA